MLRLASILLVPAAHDGPARATTKALPLLSSVVVVLGPVPRTFSSGPTQVTPPAQREFSSLLLRKTRSLDGRDLGFQC
jgi:hypothetical protein